MTTLTSNSIRFYLTLPLVLVALVLLVPYLIVGFIAAWLGGRRTTSLLHDIHKGFIS